METGAQVAAITMRIWPFHRATLGRWSMSSMPGLIRWPRG
jgi:hypothetical protein